jgi:hypothetical protein
MEILIKKGSSGDKTTATIKDIADLLEITHIKKLVRDSQVLSNKFIQDYKPKKEDVLPLLKDSFKEKGEITNISFAESIEKDSNIPTGSIYYNESKDCVRIKKKSGWVNLI